MARVLTKEAQDKAKNANSIIKMAADGKEKDHIKLFYPPSLVDDVFKLIDIGENHSYLYFSMSKETGFTVDSCRLMLNRYRSMKK